MRFLVLIKASRQSEAGVMPSVRQLEEMTAFNEELGKAGVLLAADGVLPSSKGARINVSGGKTSVTDGPFAETKELIAGFWIVQGKSKEEVIERFVRVPLEDGEVEIRQMFDIEDFDFGEHLTPEERENFQRRWEVVK